MPSLGKQSTENKNIYCMKTLNGKKASPLFYAQPQTLVDFCKLSKISETYFSHLNYMCTLFLIK